MVLCPAGPPPEAPRGGGRGAGHALPAAPVRRGRSVEEGNTGPTEPGAEAPGRRTGRPAPPPPPHHGRRGPIPAMSSGRTGARVSGRPVAWRTAATIAGVEESVGGSPAPRSP